MRIPPLKAIIAFESVARTKSVNRAADELGLTASAVSHQLSNLESLIGQPLFQRSGRGLVLTPTGERYLADVTGSLADLSRATERASSGTEVDILRVHSSPSFGLMWLLPRLSSFQQANGDIQLNLACSYENVSFSNGFYDIDVRHGYGNWDNLEVRTVRGEFIAPLAAPRYLERHPVHAPKICSRTGSSIPKRRSSSGSSGSVGPAYRSRRRRRSIFRSIVRTCRSKPQRSASASRSKA